MIKIAAWLVHIYTASGGVLALLALIAINNHQWALSFIWLMICFFIDGTDGLLARKFRVGEVLPLIDGKNIDYVVDFLTYAFVPAYFIYESDLVSAPLRLSTAIYVILISALYYGKKEMVSEKMKFTGFPVLWNLVVFYTFFIFNSGPIFNLFFIFFFGILHFVPIQISYPSKNLRENAIPFVIGVIMLAVFVMILYLYPRRSGILTSLSIISFAYFIYQSIWFTWFSRK